MRGEEKKEEEKKQKRNGQLPSAKRGLFFLLPHHGKNVAHQDDGAFKYLSQQPLSKGGVTRHLVHLENFSAIISSDVSGIH